MLIAPLSTGIGRLTAPGCSGRLGAVRHGRNRDWHRQRCGELLGGLPDRGILAIDNGANRVAKVTQQVLPICDLRGIWSPLARTVGVSTGSVAGHDLNSRMLMQPSC